MRESQSREEVSQSVSSGVFSSWVGTCTRGAASCGSSAVFQTPGGLRLLFSVLLSTFTVLFLLRRHYYQSYCRLHAHQPKPILALCSTLEEGPPK